MTNTEPQQKIDFAQFAPSRNHSIPNLISLLRLALIPVFIALYLRGYPGWAVAVVIFSAITDMVDGYIARHYDQITTLGKVLDPIADKLTQISLAVCLCLSFRTIIPLMIILLVKELTMLVMGLRLLRTGREPFSAMWFGKLATIVFYAGVLAIMAFSDQLGSRGVTAISITISVVLLFALVRYFVVFNRFIGEEQKHELS